MRLSELWHLKMDDYKRAGQESRFPETKALYYRMEMKARVEIELAEALEKMGVKP